MVSGWKTSSCDEEVAESKAAKSSPTQLGALLQKADVAHVCLRLLCMASSVTALSFMVTATQASTVSIYGFHLPVYVKWSFSESFEDEIFESLDTEMVKLALRDTIWHGLEFALGEIVEDVVCQLIEG